MSSDDDEMNVVTFEIGNRIIQEGFNVYPKNSDLYDRIAAKVDRDPNSIILQVMNEIIPNNSALFLQLDSTVTVTAVNNLFHHSKKTFFGKLFLSFKKTGFIFGNEK